MPGSELAAALEKTEGAVQALADKVDIHQTTLRRNKIAVWTALFGLVLDVTLTVLVGWGLFGVNNNQSRINQLQNQVQVETDRNKGAQCAMIALFLQFEPKTTANPAYTPDQRALQTQLYQTLRQIGVDLGCVTK